MNAIFFKPFGNQIVKFMAIYVSKPTSFTPIWVEHFSDLSIQSLGLFGIQKMCRQAFFLHTPVLLPEKHRYMGHGGRRPTFWGGQGGEGKPPLTSPMVSTSFQPTLPTLPNLQTSMASMKLSFTFRTNGEIFSDL